MNWTVRNMLVVGLAWAGHPVGFNLITQGDRQYVQYYNEKREIVLASRLLSAATWDTAIISGKSPVFGDDATPTITGWDSHNYVALGFDNTGHIHLSGNMHCNPLLYFRTTRPGDIHSFQRLDHMTGQLESKVTYPRFLNRADGTMIFGYRDGYSGSGADIYNLYNATDRSWTRLLDQPLHDGRNQPGGKTSNAYVAGPIRGPDGQFHAVWVWRDTGACETNHSLSYARSPDFQHWFDSNGKPLTLPITPQTSEIVDPVPVRGGMINGNTVIGFDAASRVVITYHKYDATGNTQVFNARRINNTWQIVQASHWNYRWSFEGTGSMIFDVHLGPIEVAPGGRLRQSWWNRHDGIGGTYLDPETLAPTAPYLPPSRYPESLLKPESPLPGMEVRWAETGANPFEKDRVLSAPGSRRYVLRWETLRENRDQAPQGSPPPPSQLRLYELELVR